MASIIKETVKSDANSVTHSVSEKVDSIGTWIRIFYYILGVVETLLAFRFIFKAAGANPLSGFVNFIYALTLPLTLPFEGIFRPVASQGSVIDPSILMAMAVYAILVVGIINLYLILTRQPEADE